MLLLAPSALVHVLASSAPAAMDPHGRASDSGGQPVLDVPRDQAHVEAKSLEANPTLVGGRNPYGVGGMCIYRLQLDPGESVLLRMKSEPGGDLDMSIPLPPHMDEFTPQIKAVNRQLHSVRATRMEFKNSSTHPYDLLVLVTGNVNYAYGIDIERSR